MAARKFWQVLAGHPHMEVLAGHPHMRVLAVVLAGSFGRSFGRKFWQDTHT